MDDLENKLHIGGIPENWMSKDYIFTTDIVDVYKNNTEILNNAIKALEEQHKKDENYKQELLNTLKLIESNTAGLREVISLIQSSNDKQDEIFDILTEILSIAKEKDKEKAQGKVRKVMNRINQFSGDVETIIKLAQLVATVYTMLKASGALKI